MRLDAVAHAEATSASWRWSVQHGLHRHAGIDEDPAMLNALAPAAHHLSRWRRQRSPS